MLSDNRENARQLVNGIDVVDKPFAGRLEWFVANHSKIRNSHISDADVETALIFVHQKLEVKLVIGLTSTRLLLRTMAGEGTRWTTTRYSASSVDVTII